LEKLQAYKRRMGWSFPWASSHDGDFNFDFCVGFTEAQQRDEGIEYNYRRETPLRERSSGPVSCCAAACGTDAATFLRERPGMSPFVLEDGVIYHTYSTYARGLGWPLGGLSVARPRAERAQRAGRLVAPPRRVRPWLRCRSHRSPLTASR